MNVHEYVVHIEEGQEYLWALTNRGLIYRRLLGRIGDVFNDSETWEKFDGPCE